MQLDNARILVVDGSSGIGFGVTEMAQTAGAKVTIASRSKEKVQAALECLGGEVRGLIDNAERVLFQRNVQGSIARHGNHLLQQISLPLWARMRPMNASEKFAVNDDEEEQRGG